MKAICRSMGAASVLVAVLGGAATFGADAPRPAPASTVGTPPPAASPPTAAAAKVELFSPQGTARGVRQVVARFSQPMVALGDPRLADPFDVRCAPPGTGRWADGRTWIYDFDADLEAGTSCRFALRAGTKTLAGAAVGGRTSFAFDTGGPAVVGSLPREGSDAIDEEQYFLLKLDAPASSASVAARAYCAVDGVGERIPVEVIEGERRTEFLKNRAALGYDYYWLLWKNGETSDARVRNRTFEQQDAAIVVVHCLRRLPPATQMRLVWGKGIATASGIATTMDQPLAYRVRPTFTAQVQCSRTNARAGCIPSLPVTVQFSSPVPAALAAQVRIRANGREWTPEAVPGGASAKGAKRVDAKSAENGAIPATTVEQVTFTGPFPESTTLQVAVPADLRDDAGRPLENAARFPVALRVDAYPPLAKFAGRFGILEAAEGGVLPVTLRNVEPQLAATQFALPAKTLRLDGDAAAIASWLERVNEADESRGDWIDAKDAPAGTAQPERARMGEEGEEAPTTVWREDTGDTSLFGTVRPTSSFTLTKPAGDRPAEVVGIPLRTPGFYVVEIESRRLGQALLGRDQPRYVSTAALVTNLSVHFKWGREGSRAWVTRLDTGAPVAGAEIVVADYCGGAERWRGRTDAQGVAAIDGVLGAPHGNQRCNPYSPTPLLVVAKLGDDFSFVQSGWADGIAPYSFGLQTGSAAEADVFHTVLDRALFRAGEKVSMKHVLRRHRGTGMTPIEGLPAKRKVWIRHGGSGQEYTLQAAFGADGIATGEWKIPAEAKLGDYSIEIETTDGRGRRSSGSFKVQQFRLPSMRASVAGPGRPLVRPTSVPLDLHVAYLSGGGASGLPVKVRTVVEPRPVSFADYGDFTFGGKPVVEGVVTGSGGYYDLDFEREPEAATDTMVRVLPLTLDGSGSARIDIGDLPPLDGPAQLVAELEYPDANGELLSATGRVRLLPASLHVGLRTEGWAGNAKQVRFRAVVLDLDGKPRANEAVNVALYQAETFSYRKRLVGGFYAYESTTATKRLPAKCEGRTNAQGLLLCDVAPGVSGEVLLRAEARGADGRVAAATTSTWVAGDDDWWFGGTSGDRMDLIPEKKEYEAGDVARFQVRMPFRTATALVTVEREGVLTSFVTKLSGRAPVVEVPIAPAFAPNVYVSVLAVRGRVPRADGPSRDRDGEITALVDLRKPAFRLGNAQIKVGWKPHRLDVRVATERPTYKVRERAKVSVEVKRADGAPLPAGTEVAIAAVDEALLDLQPNGSWALLDAMMGERGLEVWTATGQTQVVGKRHYGRKAVPHGGGGGRERDRGRELFDSLLVWKPRVVVDADGRATLDVPLNDSLTAFRIVAVATGGAQWFGTGSAVVNTTQDLILVSGLPPVVREGDRYAATFTVRNTSDRTISAIAEATATPAGKLALAAQRVELAPGQARDLVWQADVPYDAREQRWQVNVRDANGAARDRLSVTASVQTVYPVRTYQATLAQLGPEPLQMPAAAPAGSVPGRGGLEVTLRARLGDGLDGVKEYMASYPYICIEQQLSRAVALGDRALWDRWIERLPAYMDRDGLLRYFPTDRLEGDDTLTAYVLAIAAEAGWPIGDADRERLQQALTRFVSGQVVRRSALPTADLAIRKLAAIDALSRHGAANAAMLDTITIDPALWPTSALLDWVGILRRVDDVRNRDARREQALGLLRARLNFQGTTMGFSTERGDALWWLMVSGDSNANRMLLAVLDDPSWREDVPRLVRGALGRQQRGHWNTTVANAWGALAMWKFSAAFESVPVTGATAVTYGAQQRSVTWPAKTGATEVDVPWLPGTNTLSVAHTGTGRPWAIVRATAALPLAKPLSTGFKVTRTVTAVEAHAPGRWTRGDIVRVRLDLEAQSDMSWVVVDDPVPAGATILGTGLGGQSAIATAGERRSGVAWLAYEERRFDAFRAYYRFVPKGRWSVEYTVRLNNPGTFGMPATRVEAMYAPEMFGELPNANVAVEPSP